MADRRDAPAQEQNEHDPEPVVPFLKHCQFYARLGRVPSYPARLIDAVGRRLLRSWEPNGPQITTAELTLWVGAVESCRDPAAQEAALVRAMAFAPVIEPEPPTPPQVEQPLESAPPPGGGALGLLERARGKAKAVPVPRPRATTSPASDGGPDYDVSVPVSLPRSVAVDPGRSMLCSVTLVGARVRRATVGRPLMPRRSLVPLAARVGFRTPSMASACRAG